MVFGDNLDQTVLLTDGDQDNSQYAGLDYDSESATQHAQFRQYSSTAGRWMSPDPYDGSYDMTNPQSLNRYSYVKNNPLNAKDPAGEDDGDDCGDAGTPNGDSGGDTEGADSSTSYFDSNGDFCSSYTDGNSAGVSCDDGSDSAGLNTETATGSTGSIPGSSNSAPIRRHSPLGHSNSKNGL